MSFIAKRVSRSHTIHLDAPLAQAFALFDPIGERHWAPGWDPEIVYPPSGKIGEGTVFLTRPLDEPPTVWRVEAYDCTRHYVRYLRMTPESRLGDVEVQCHSVDPGRTAVTVTYSFTALSEAGNAWVDGFSEEFYQKLIESWKTEIDKHLGSLARKP